MNTESENVHWPKAQRIDRTNIQLSGERKTIATWLFFFCLKRQSHYVYLEYRYCYSLASGERTAAAGARLACTVLRKTVDLWLLRRVRACPQLGCYTGHWALAERSRECKTCLNSIHWAYLGLIHPKPLGWRVRQTFDMRIPNCSVMRCHLPAISCGGYRNCCEIIVVRLKMSRQRNK